jgi:hypothetical protein
MLYKYPCGCIGIGTPPDPVPVGEGVPGMASVEWRGVWTVHRCDTVEIEDSGWKLPQERVMTGNSGKNPVPCPEFETSYLEFLSALRGTP